MRAWLAPVEVGISAGSGQITLFPGRFHLSRPRIASGFLAPGKSSSLSDPLSNGCRTRTCVTSTGSSPARTTAGRRTSEVDPSFRAP
jgi:hypothetical protein